MKTTFRMIFTMTIWLLFGAFATTSPSLAQSQSSQPAPSQGGTYSPQEIIDAGHAFFGKTTGGLAEMVEYVFRQRGRPNAYIVGEEAAGSFVGGLRYGEGTIHPKFGGQRKIYWQGPSIGLDFGGNGSRVLTLIYNLRSMDDIYYRIPGVEGSAYVVGGLGVNFLQRYDLVLAPIRTGVGARLGVNVGYLKYTPKPTWNPF